MNIGIIGAGWLGCHTALTLKKLGHSVTIFEQNKIFQGSSRYNQNRLHLGFHYARNKKTRNLCYDTFNRFISDYYFLVDDLNYNYYIISEKHSILDFDTYKLIFQSENIPFTQEHINWLENIEGGILVKEKYINPNKAAMYFEQELSTNLVNKKITNSDIPMLCAEYDYVVNTTNNILKTIPQCYYELCLTLVYNKVQKTQFDAVTLVDGSLFSIYPYIDNKFTLTDVVYTSLFTDDEYKNIKLYEKNLSSEDIFSIRKKMEDKVNFYYKDFLLNFQYDSYFISTKVKKNILSADRYPVIKKEGNLISCVTGKIQGIYILQDYISNEIIGR